MQLKYKKLFPDYKKKVVTFSFDDGTYQDVEMINILNMLNMKATFNINSAIMNNSGDFYIDKWLLNYKIDKSQINIIYKDHEIAGHTSTHTNFSSLDDEFLKKEIDDDVAMLRKLTKRKIIGYAYPYGIYNEKIIERLKKCGILYARSVKSTFNFSLPTDWYTYGGTCTISDKCFSSLTNKWLRLKPKDLKIFYIWGHTYELDMFHEHERVYKLLSKLANKDDCWYASNGQIVTYLLSFEKLSYSKKYNTLKNNSNVDLYLSIDNKNYLIKAKEKIKLEK